jgi:hypothetical protein
MNRIEQADSIADQIKALSGLDIFKNTRQREYVEARSLLIFLMYNTLNYRLSEIERYFIERGKHYNHATVLYALRNFNSYRQFNKNISKWLTIITNKDTLVLQKTSIILENIKALRSEDINVLYNIVQEMYTQQLNDPNNIEVKEPELVTP